jgi:hypothetical protein
MAYQDQHDLAEDRSFQDRVTMCVAEQAEVYVDDTRPEFQSLAYQAMAALEATAGQFVPLAAVRPGMTVASTDGDILAAVQYLWAKVGARYAPVAPATP